MGCLRSSKVSWNFGRHSALEEPEKLRKKLFLGEILYFHRHVPTQYPSCQAQHFVECCATTRGFVWQWEKFLVTRLWFQTNDIFAGIFWLILDDLADFDFNFKSAKNSPTSCKISKSFRNSIWGCIFLTQKVWCKNIASVKRYIIFSEMGFRVVFQAFLQRKSLCGKPLQYCHFQNAVTFFRTTFVLESSGLKSHWTAFLVCQTEIWKLLWDSELG